jgi:hypothetical protein
VTATANHSKAKVIDSEINKTLDVGTNIINITVTAEDGTTQIYTLTVIRSDHVLVTEAILNTITLNGKEISSDSLEYVAACDEEVFEIQQFQASPYSTVMVDDIEYSLNKYINLTGDVTTVNIRIIAETGETETPYILKILAPVNDDGLYFQRWDDVIALNCNPKHNGNRDISKIRWYNKQGRLISEKNYIRLQGQVSDYYAEILINDEWHRVCGVPTVRPEIVAYPNPVWQGESLKLQLSNIFVDGTLNIYSINGTLQKSRLPLPASNTEINVSDLSPGIYLLQLVPRKGKYQILTIVIE